MVECEACDGLGFFVWDYCSDGCCRESITCIVCVGDGEMPSPIWTQPPSWWDCLDGAWWDDRI